MEELGTAAQLDRFIKELNRTVSPKPRLDDLKKLKSLVTAACQSLSEAELPWFLERAHVSLPKDMSKEGIVEEALWHAATEGNVRVVNGFLQTTGIDLNWADPEHHRTSFYRACSHGRLEVVKILLKDPRIDPTKPIKLGATPFFIACQEGFREVVDLLLEDDRVDPNHADDQRVTPFFIASQNIKMEVVKSLCMSEKVNMNLARSDGCSPIFYAVSYSRLDIVKWILSTGEQVRLDLPWTPTSRNAIQQAQISKFQEASDLMKEYVDNPAATVMKLREELGQTHSMAADIFVLSVLLSDHYLSIKTGYHSNPATTRFFQIAAKLPMELQMLLCNRRYQIMKNTIPAKLVEKSTRKHFKYYDGKS